MMTELKNKNRGYMKLVVWEKASDLFEMAFELAYNGRTSRIAEDEPDYLWGNSAEPITPLLHHSTPPPLPHSTTPTAA